jgi:hypothetical protein
MIRTILNILLIGAIVTCPLRCLAGLCNSGDGCCSAAERCCQRCDAQEHCAAKNHGASQQSRADGNLGHPSSMPFEPTRSGGCQCICSGALVGLSGILLAEHVQHSWPGLLVPDDLAAPLGVAAKSSTHPPDWARVASGQSLCILHRVLLL